MRRAPPQLSSVSFAWDPPMTGHSEMYHSLMGATNLTPLSQRGFLKRSTGPAAPWRLHPKRPIWATISDPGRLAFDNRSRLNEIRSPFGTRCHIDDGPFDLRRADRRRVRGLWRHENGLYLAAVPGRRKVRAAISLFR